MDQPGGHASNHAQIVWGIVITAAGVLLLMQRLDVADVYLTTRLWPLAPLTLGLLRLIDPPPPSGSRRSGATLLLVGVWGVLNEAHIYGLTYERSWPLMIIVAGVGIVWRSTECVPPGTGRGRRER